MFIVTLSSFSAKAFHVILAAMTNAAMIYEQLFSADSSQVREHWLARVRRPELLLVDAADETGTTYGCDQDWYEDAWQRRAGCGPCTAASIMFYLGRRYAKLLPLYDRGSASQSDFSHLMHEVWQYVTPGRMGVNEAHMLSRGAERYAATKSVMLVGHELKVPGLYQSRAPLPQLVQFIRQGLEKDCPVAFLNLSNGSLDNLESWHWVTVTAMLRDPEDQIQLIISDSGELKKVNLSQWFGSSLLGGALVTFSWPDA